MSRLRVESGTGQKVLFDPLDPAFSADPFPLLRRLREEDPIHLSPMGRWVFTRYDDVRDLLRDQRFCVSFDREALCSQLGDGAALAFLSRRLTTQDPPNHTRIRSLVSKAFGVERIVAMRLRVETIAEELLDQVGSAPTMDLIADLANPLPSLVMCEFFGVPKTDRSRFSTWTEDIAYATPPIVDQSKLAAGERAAAEFMDYVRLLIAKRRSSNGDDLVTALIAAEQAGDRLSEDEMVAIIVLLFTSGHQTTRDLAGNGLIGLLRHPEQIKRLVANPNRMPDAVEECLRYDPSVTMTGRRALEDVMIREKKIAIGERVILSLSAANRDPLYFTDPDKFDIDRSFKSHLTFGAGIHYCLGAMLARVELEVILGRLLHRWPRLELADDTIQWRKTILFRGPLALNLRLFGTSGR